jgi:hypothetical protein
MQRAFAVQFSEGYVKRFRSILAVVALLAANGAAFAQTTPQRADFKGAALGMPIEEWRAVNSGHFNLRYSCRAVEARFKALGDTNCTLQSSQRETIAGVEAKSASFWWYGDALSSIRIAFDSSQYIAVVDALTERWGKPTAIEEREVVTGAGARLSNTITRWRIGGDIIEASRYGSSIRESGVRYTSEATLAEFDRRSGDAAKKGSKDL